MVASSKSGQLEVPLNWLFILIAGGAILITFFAFIQRQQSASELSIAENLVSDLESIASVAGTAKGTAQQIDFPEEDITIGCTPDCSCLFSIGAISKPFGTNLIYSPNLIRGPNLVLYSIDWNVPFRANNLLILTNSRTRYILITPTLTPPINRLISIIPNMTNLRVAKGPEAQTAKNQRQPEGKIRFIYFSQGQCDDFRGIELDEQDFSCLEVDLEKHTLDFYYRNRAGTILGPDRQTYLSEGDLIGALFTESPDQYRCNSQAEMLRLANLASVYQRRAANVTTSTCGKSYTDAATQFERLATEARKAENASKLLLHYSILSNLSEEFIRLSCKPELF
ncbi:hypothetical protein HY641_04940 [Candidatus Woesearchaeota archaeon]|nr:hypothetical protein [Candidatus Woesearchaeota archaeon]